MRIDLLLSLIQAGKFALDTAELYGKGELSDEELKTRLGNMRARLDAANDAWEQNDGMA